MHKILRYLIALVWLINGLYCKVLNGVPRHQEIVARILGTTHATLFTKAIGIAEILMAVWIISRIQPPLNAVAQMLIIATMNAIEYFMAPDLLLFGHWNAVVALLFIAVIYSNEFLLRRQQHSHVQRP